jgi:zinc transport system substrate-binding protein
MREAARRVADALTELDPDNGSLYRQNLERFEEEVDDLDRSLRSELAGLEGREILVYHPAWGCLAREYGLTQVAIEKEGKEPGPSGLTALVGQARKAGVRVIFVQQGFSTKSAQVVAEEVGARVVALDPLAYDWLANLRAVAAAFRDALGTEAPTDDPHDSSEAVDE